jgi:hypothetical protein
LQAGCVTLQTFPSIIETEDEFESVTYITPVAGSTIPPLAPGPTRTVVFRRLQPTLTRALQVAASNSVTSPAVKFVANTVWVASSTMTPNGDGPTGTVGHCRRQPNKWRTLHARVSIIDSVLSPLFAT